MIDGSLSLTGHSFAFMRIAAMGWSSFVFISFNFQPMAHSLIKASDQLVTNRLSCPKALP